MRTLPLFEWAGRLWAGGNQIFILAAKNLKLMAFMFKTMECCSKDYSIGHISITSVLHYQHQWELEQKKTKDTEMPKIG